MTGECQETFSSTLEPVVKWHWTSSDNRDRLYVVPIVADLDPLGVGPSGEDGPEIIFTVFSGGNKDYGDKGWLRVLKGSSGLLDPNFPNGIPDVTTNSVRPCANCEIVVADLDNDLTNGLEIVVLQNQLQLAAYHYIGDGSLTPAGHLYWQMTTDLPTSETGVNHGGPAIADLYNDGTPEVIIGAVAVNGQTGTIVGSSGGGVAEAKQPSSGVADFGPLSIIADMDLDGEPEIITGSNVWNRDGSLHCSTGITNGFPGVADFMGDGHPEIVVVYNNRLYMHDYLCNPAPGWTDSIDMPGSGIGGAPTIGDFDGDGIPEIGVALDTNYVVYNHDQSLLWSHPITDESSHMTGSTSFDFNNDGKVEILYRSEYYFYVFKGEGNGDGTTDVLFQWTSGSGTGLEYPTVADVDADDEAEIILPANPLYGSDTGVTVFEADPTISGNRWNTTRPIWNQHTYHITNINDDGTVPAVEENNWEVYNNYRVNQQPPQFTALADLVAKITDVRDLGEGYMEVDVRITNIGEVDVPAGESFYIGLLDNDSGLFIVNEEITSGISAGGGQIEKTYGDYFECGNGLDFTVFVNSTPLTIEECDYDNNQDSYSCDCDCS